MSNKQQRPRKVFAIFATILAVLVILSLISWGKLTDYTFKDYNLLSDVLTNYEVTYESEEILDPELDVLTEEVAESNSNNIDSDTVATNVNEELEEEIIIPDYKDDFIVPRKNGIVMIEDYTTNGDGLATLKANLSSASNRLVRIAMIGDSYIEGDLFSQNIRASLQDKYGGCGVGYVPAYSIVAGFRQSVKQTSDGWKEHEIRKISSDGLRNIQGKYHEGAAGAIASYQGSKYPAHLSQWDSSLLLFIAPSAGTITFTAGEYTETHTIDASESVQALKLEHNTSNFEYTSDIDGLIVLGAWLDGNSGISFDNMSLRGNSGISHRKLNAELAAQMRNNVDYDLIILEFGINALSSSETNYNYYSTAMIKSVNSIKTCYPNAQILIMGIGDRGQKIGTEVGSMKTAPYMVNAQRSVARQTGSLFWDIRESMGGDGAVVDWNEKGLINDDYIHLNGKGGKALAELFIKSLNTSIGE